MMWSILNSHGKEIRIDWEMFNSIQDDKMLDLVHFCGNPFPRQQIGQHVGTEEGKPSMSDDNSTDCQPSFRVILKPHEGIRADDPFRIYPQQMVVFLLILVQCISIISCVSVASSTWTRCSRHSISSNNGNSSCSGSRNCLLCFRLLQH